MSHTKILYREFSSLKEDGSIEVILHKKLNIITLIINENGSSIKIRYDLTIEGDTPEDRISYVDNLRRKANLLGRASQEIKNIIKKELFKELLEEGSLDQSEYDIRMGNTKGNG